MPAGSVTVDVMNHCPGVSTGRSQLRTPGAPTKAHLTVFSPFVAVAVPVSPVPASGMTIVGVGSPV